MTASRKKAMLLILTSHAKERQRTMTNIRRSSIIQEEYKKSTRIQKEYKYYKKRQR
jgi:hypothetical protein